MVDARKGVSLRILPGARSLCTVQPIARQGRGARSTSGLRWPCRALRAASCDRRWVKTRLSSRERDVLGSGLPLEIQIQQRHPIAAPLGLNLELEIVGRLARHLNGQRVLPLQHMVDRNADVVVPLADPFTVEGHGDRGLCVIGDSQPVLLRGERAGRRRGRGRARWRRDRWLYWTFGWPSGGWRGSGLLSRRGRLGRLRGASGARVK